MTQQTGIEEIMIQAYVQHWGGERTENHLAIKSTRSIKQIKILQLSTRMIKFQLHYNSLE